MVEIWGVKGYFDGTWDPHLSLPDSHRGITSLLSERKTGGLKKKNTLKPWQGRGESEVVLFDIEFGKRGQSAEWSERCAPSCHRFAALALALESYRLAFYPSTPPPPTPSLSLSPYLSLCLSVYLSLSLAFSLFVFFCPPLTIPVYMSTSPWPLFCPLSLRLNCNLCFINWTLFHVN